MQDGDDLEFLLPGQAPGEGIKQSDFQHWKHHPVTKAYLHFLKEYAEFVRREQVDLLNSATSMPDGFMLGKYTGRFNAFAELSAFEFAHLMNFYPTVDETSEETDAA